MVLLNIIIASSKSTIQLQDVDLAVWIPDEVKRQLKEKVSTNNNVSSGRDILTMLSRISDISQSITVL